jgi:DNA processing protein
MSPTEAAALALLGARDRRLLAAILRFLKNRSTADDLDALPRRAPGEALIPWVCRCRASPDQPDESLVAAARVEAEALAQIEHAARMDITTAVFDADEYPTLLASIPDPPALLWIRGDVTVLSSRAIAVVGSRSATPYGLAIAAKIAGDLAAAGFVIVSGLARGVDSAAHVAALTAGGKSVGVLGCGIDRVYPPEHKPLAARVQRSGAVISEFPPGVPPLPHHFPLRNRIVSGLSRAVVVIEAPEKSGALITASTALEQGREVMVVPGPAVGGRNRGGHLLIRDGAKVVESADDILHDMNGQPLFSSDGPLDQDLGQLPEITDFTVDDVARLTGEPPSTVLARLLDLELAGRIQRIGGGRFSRVLT